MLTGRLAKKKLATIAVTPTANRNCATLRYRAFNLTSGNNERATSTYSRAKIALIWTSPVGLVKSLGLTRRSALTEARRRGQSVAKQYRRTPNSETAATPNNGVTGGALLSAAGARSAMRLEPPPTTPRTARALSSRAFIESKYRCASCCAISDADSGAVVSGEISAMAAAYVASLK